MAYAIDTDTDTIIMKDAAAACFDTYNGFMGVEIMDYTGDNAPAEGDKVADWGLWEYVDFAAMCRSRSSNTVYRRLS